MQLDGGQVGLEVEHLSGMTTPSPNVSPLRHVIGRGARPKPTSAAAAYASAIFIECPSR